MRTRKRLLSMGLALAVMGCAGQKAAADLKEAHSLLAQKKYEEAGKLIKVFVRDHPENGDGHLLMGRYFMKSGFMAEAEESYAKGVALVEPLKKTQLPETTWEKEVEQAYRDMAKVEIRRAANMIKPSEKEAQSASADRAIGYLNKVLTFAPDDQKVKDTLAEVKKAYQK